MLGTFIFAARYAYSGMLAIETVNLRKVYKVKTISGYAGEGPGGMLYGIYKALTAKWRVVEALRGVNLKVERGSFHGLLGPNGSGKTTLLEILATLRVPTEGRAFVMGYDTVRERSKVLEVIDYIPGILTGGAWVNGNLTGRQNLMIMAKMYGISKDKVDEVLSLVNLQEEADRPAGTYSSGLYARLVIALGLLREAQVMLMDEPFAGISYETRAELKEYLARLSHEKGVTILYSTHDLEEAEELCDSVSLMYRGRIIAAGSPRELISSLGKSKVIIIESSRVSRGTLSKLSSSSDFLDFDEELVNAERSTYRMRIRVEEVEGILPKLIRFLIEEGCHIHHIRIKEPSLKDVFLHYAKGGEGAA